MRIIISLNDIIVFVLIILIIEKTYIYIKNKKKPSFFAENN